MDREPTVTKRHPALGECERRGVNKPPSRPSAPEPEAGSNSSRGFVSLPWAVGVNEDTPRDGFHSETGPGENASYRTRHTEPRGSWPETPPSRERYARSGFNERKKVITRECSQMEPERKARRNARPRGRSAESGLRGRPDLTSVLAAQSCLSLCHPVEYIYSPLYIQSTGFRRPRILAWVAFPFSGESSQPRHRT